MPEPSVGDLLAAARRRAEQMLGRAEASDAAALAAGWQHVLDSACALLTAMPTTVVGDEPPAADEQYLTTRVAAMAAQTRRAGPPAVAPHPEMVHVGDTLERAADLVARHAHDGMTRTPAARADLEAARVQIARTLAAGAHAVARELGTNARALQAADPKKRPAPRPLSSSRTARWVQLAQDQEQVNLDYAARSPGRSAHNQGATVPTSPLGVRLATWSTTLLRAAADPQVSSGDLRHIAAGQAWALHAATGLTLAAVDLLQVHRTAAPLLLQRLQDGAAAWSATAQTWSWLTTPDRREPTPAVLAATSTTIAAVNAVLRTGNTWATPAQVAARLEGTAVTSLLRTVAETSRILADCHAQLPGQLSGAGRLRAPARVLLDLTTERYQRPAASHPQEEDPSPAALPVDLRDVAANRLVSLTPAAWQSVHHSCVELTRAAHAAHTAVLVHAPTGEPRTGRR